MYFRFFLSIGLILVSAVAGYMARRRAWAPAWAAKPLMTVVTVVGYPSVGFMAIWGAPIHWNDIWLPLLGGLQATLMALCALGVGVILFPNRVERGLVGISCTVGNHGVTMAGFAIYLLFGVEGLGLSTVYAIYTFFALVLLLYTIAQRYARASPQQSILHLMSRNLVHWRATGLYTCLLAILLTGLRIPPPAQIETWHLLDTAIYVLIAVSYFAIGMGLRLSNILKVRRAIFYVMGIRHGVGLLLGLTLAGLTQLTPWPLQGLSREVFLLQSSVPMGVMGIAVANMFELKPGEASAIFVTTSLAYLVIGLPVLSWIFGT